MLALFTIIAMGTANDPAPNGQVLAANMPSYTVHVRELTAPERVTRVQLDSSVCITDAVPTLKRPPRDITRMDMWIVRRDDRGKEMVLPVDWAGISRRGEFMTNYIVLDGDRLFIQARPGK